MSVIALVGNRGIHIVTNSRTTAETIPGPVIITRRQAGAIRGGFPLTPAPVRYYQEFPEG